MVTLRPAVGAAARPSRKRTRISYKESTDDGSDDPNDVDVSARPMTKRARISYKEPTDDGSDESEDELELSSPRRKITSSHVVDRPAHAAGRRQALRSQASTRSRRRVRPRRKADKAKPAGGLSHGRSRRKTVPQVPVEIPAPILSDNIILPWQTLEYDILLQIFTFASYPFHDENFKPTPSITWLLNAARTCKAFAEPALTAFYRCPPLLALDKPHYLLELLSLPPEKRTFDYNVKVKKLELDVWSALAYTAPGKGLFDLPALLLKTPQLSELEFSHHADRPPYRRLDTQVRWTYPAQLITALKNGRIHLKSWTWNFRFNAHKICSLPWWKSTYQSIPFQSLEKLNITNQLAGRDLHSGSSNDTMAEELADVIGVFPKLTELTVECCLDLDERFLVSLPNCLTHLSIINCVELDSDSLNTFLVTKGGQLKELVLNHNQTLDIGFLPHLKSSCPKLELLRMDLNYYHCHFHCGSSPGYISLLNEDEIPTWPATLRVLEMTQLRKWTSEAAKMLFDSLINSAKELPDLRRLVLKVILNIGWRDRAGFRDECIGRLQRVFLRKSAPPSQHLQSLRAFRIWKKLQETGSAPAATAARGPTDAAEGHIADEEDNLAVDVSERTQPDGGMESETDSDAPLTQNSQRRSKRIAAQETPAEGLSQTSNANHTRSYRETNSDTDPSDTDPGPDAESKRPPGDWRKRKENWMQGMCDVVDVRIDNLRPTENQFSEGDFLDEEVSGDEDWTGVDMTFD